MAKSTSRLGESDIPAAGVLAADVAADAPALDAPTTDTSAAEEARPPESDHPAQPDFPIVGIGASAGGLAAFEAFFSGMPAGTDPGMAFVLVQHLAPDHKSILTELIRRYTRMQVFEVEDGMLVQPNCAYIIPPKCDMAFLNGALHLFEPSAPRGLRLPIDFFFRSLAQDQGERAICIVLSGTGSDGTQGVRAIKGEGGMAMAQSPASTEYNGMPRSAIATRLVDYELPPAEMPAQLMAYVAHAFNKQSRSIVAPAPKAESALKKIFILLRDQTGHDFSQYKPSTINRRIERRLAVHQIETFDGYVKYVQQTPTEVEALFRDLLIGVTSFFRDPEAFKTLEEEAIPKLFADKPADATIRVWSPGCSTGEEAYSLAILLQEHLESLAQSYKVQVFATDIDSRAVDTARAGLYPASIAADVSPVRLARFFTPETGGGAYRVSKVIRDLLVFSEQDVTRDPPFSKLDLISCRNVLIYMGGALQKKLIPLFHYALSPGGVLFLSTSETVGEFSDLFVALDRKSKVYQRREGFNGAQRAVPDRFLPPMMVTKTALPPSPRGRAVPERLPLRELTEQALLEQIAPAGALVNGQGDIFYLHGRTGRYLEPAPGEVGITNILKMAREGLRRDLTTALHKAAETREIVRHPGLRVKTNGDVSTVNLTIRPVTTGPSAVPSADPAAPPRPPLYLVILEEARPLDPEQVQQAAATQAIARADDPNMDVESRITVLKRELLAKDEYLQSTNEEMQSSNEELKSSNEEMQSLNEEMQSTNEELETSKEELQSINEELATVNSELQTKVADLSRVNNDMRNLLAGTGIGTVFVDHQLRILRFTPTVTRIINLIPSDVGRPVGHIVSNLVGYAGIVADTQAVLDTLVSKELDVQTTEGKWYTMHILPYRTLDNVIEGAVITFTEITELRLARAALEEARAMRRLAVVARDARDAVAVHDLMGRILAWNPGAERMYGWTEAEALAMNIRDLIPEGQREKALAKVGRLAEADVLKPYRAQRVTKAGAIVDVLLTATALADESGAVYGIAMTERTVAPRKTLHD
jgi:two-component system CheB/CheR fusion protein